VLHEFMNWYLRTLEDGGYALIALLMAMESTIVPLPSELVIPPAAYLAHSRGGMSLTGVVAAGTFGSWVGATIMYWIARLVGRPLLMRYGRYALVSPEKIAGAENWANHYGAVGIFISRLLPVIRHLIGVPAGVLRMDFRYYSLATLIGSAGWCTVLAWLGVTAGKDPAVLSGDLHRISLWLAGVVLTLGAIYYVFVHRQMRTAQGQPR
jgi:membrane protein DedA with SNARE-associated domain